MAMGDDIAGATLKTTADMSKLAVEASTKTISNITEMIFRLLRELALMRKQAKSSDVHNSNLSDIKSGTVSIKKLLEHCRKNGETIATSEQGLTKADVSAIASKAKKYGIPVAFTNNNSKDNIFATVRNSDLPIFKQICTELIKEKLDTRPQKLGNFKCQKWEIPFICQELNNYDLSAQFAETKNGEFFAMFEKNDEKAIKIARSEFVRKCNEVESDISISKDDEGFYSIKEKSTGKEFAFNGTPNRNEISEKVKSNFGYDENKANIIASKFGQEMLTGEDKQLFFSDSVISEFSYISKANWENENILAKNYDCYYVTPKKDGISRIVLQDENGKFAVLTPHKQTNKEMNQILESQLGVTDSDVAKALIEKASHVNTVNSRVRQHNGSIEELHTHDVSLQKSDFDMTNVDTVSNMRRIDDEGTVFIKTQPIDSVHSRIKRNGDTFSVTSTVTTTETDSNGNANSISSTQQLTLSFSNKKTAMQELTEMYKKQGVPESTAKEMSKNVFSKAELQSAESVLAIEKRNTSSIIVSDGTNIQCIPTAEKQQAIEEIKDKFDVSSEYAENIIEKSEDLNVIMSKNEFVQMGLVNENNKVNEDLLLASRGNEDNADYVFMKDDSFYKCHNDGNSSDNEYTQISEEEAKAFCSDENCKLSENGEMFVNGELSKGEAVDTSINDNPIMSNGHELHPESNILGNGNSDLTSYLDNFEELADGIEDTCSSIGGR